MLEVEYLHTLDSEAYAAALVAAKRSLAGSDCSSPKRLGQLASEDGVVAEAARAVLDGDETVPPLLGELGGKQTALEALEFQSEWLDDYGEREYGAEGLAEARKRIAAAISWLNR